MRCLGLTGSIGMGKTTTAALFRAEGVPVFDADQTVHRLYQPQGRAAVFLRDHLPNLYSSETGIDRHLLRQEILRDPELIERLETIVHPLVQEERIRFMMEHRKAPILVFDIPLLLEKGNLTGIDRIVVVTADAEIQRQRVLQRQGMTEELFQALLKRQMSDADKRVRADYLIDTGKGIDFVVQQISDLLKKEQSHA